MGMGRSATQRQGRSLGKDRAPPRAASSTLSKSINVRRGVVPPGNRVSNIARHFERISKDTDRTNRRYAVIRGRRARPVASSLATVEVLDSVKDAIQDESESSDSSEADDEGGDDEETHKSSDKDKASPEASGALPPQGTDDELKEPIPAQAPETNALPSQGVSLGSASTSRRTTVTSRPSSPSLLSLADLKAPVPSPLYDFDFSTLSQERNALRKALSGFWPQNVPHRSRVDDEADDPIRDPEHIFRDSSMVVRIDEPTSIIALALR